MDQLQTVRGTEVLLEGHRYELHVDRIAGQLTFDFALVDVWHDDQHICEWTANSG